MQALNNLYLYKTIEMKLAIQYLHDANGITSAVQLPFTDWQKLTSQIKKYEQSLKIKSQLSDAFDEVTQMQKGKLKKQTLSNFLDEL